MTTGSPGSWWIRCWRWRGTPFSAVSRYRRPPQHCKGSTDASALFFCAILLPPHSVLFAQQMLDLTHRWWTEREDPDIDVNDVYTFAAAVYIHIKLHSARYPDPAPFHLPDPRQSARSFTDLLTAIVALLAKRLSHNAPLLHSARTVHEVVTEEYLILESVNNELETYTPGDWVKLFEVRCSNSLSASRKRLTRFSRAPPLTYWQAGPCIPDQVASGALLGSSLVCFGPASSRPGFTGCNAALARRTSSRTLHASVLALPYQFVWCRERLL